MRIIFIRHADPDYSIDSITEKGRREAELLSKRVIKWDVNQFYCSPLGRAQATAKYSLGKLNRDAVTYPWLREFVGHVTNPATGYDHICWDLMPDYWTKESAMYDKDNWSQSNIMKSSTNDIDHEWNLVKEGIDNILANHGYIRKDSYYTVEKHNDDTIVIFCHLGVTMAMMSHLLGIAAPVLWQGFYLAPTSVTILSSEERVKGNAYFRCQVMGDTSHLYAGGEPISNSGYFAESLQENCDIIR